MNFQSFATLVLYFHHHLSFQGLSNFVCLNYPYYVDLIKVFYSNLKISMDTY